MGILQIVDESIGVFYLKREMGTEIYICDGDNSYNPPVLN